MYICIYIYGDIYVDRVNPSFVRFKQVLRKRAEAEARGETIESGDDELEDALDSEELYIPFYLYHLYL